MHKMKTEKNTIKSPEEVRKLMEDLWCSHKAGITLPKKNVFFVDLPPAEESEKSKKERDEINNEDNYGAWI